LEPSLNTMDWPSYVSMMTKPLAERTEDAHMFGWSSFYPDASGTMEPFQSNLWPPAGFNTTFYKNAQVDDLLTSAVSIVDQKQRNDTYCQVETQIWNDAPMVFLWNQRFPIVYSAKVTNVEYRPNETWYTLAAQPAQ
jgi:ABC-type transport system substrate-binding protein